MKCALELVATANFIAEQNAREKALAEQREREEMQARTIELCEKLGSELEEKALRGQHPTICFYCDKYSNRILTSTYSDYADGKLSHRCGKQIDLDLLKRWFEKYCFEVKTSNYDYRQYGWGWCSGSKIEITPAPACL